MNGDERRRAIVRCLDEIAAAVRNQRAGEPGALLGEMDWREELMRLQRGECDAA